MKKMCELFAPKAKNTAARATEVFEEEHARAVIQDTSILLLAEELMIEKGFSVEENTLSFWDNMV